MNITLDSDDKHYQKIELNSNDPIQSTHLISRDEVEIQLTNRKNLLTETTSTDDVNQIFSQPIIDHNWESRYYAGHLVVTCGSFVAYALKRQIGDDIVCVFYKQVDFRSVINPPFSGDIHDLAFSFSDDILLACVDQACHLRIYRIEKNIEPDELQHTLILFVDLQYSNNPSLPTISWCCFIPDNSDSEDNDAYTMMSVTRGSTVEVLNVANASQSWISDSVLTLNQIESGRLTYEDNTGNVTCVCFSPDGTALGTGTDKGEIKFFSINFEQPQICRCLHVWIPHEGRPISSLFFLDDHKNLTQDTQLWRYAVSGCDQNRELKVWSCTNWNCLQVLRFTTAFHPTSQLPMLKASIDLTSRFLVVSDIQRNSMYVLTIFQDADGNRAYFSSINAFTSFKSPALSFAITAADQISGKHNDFVTYGVRMYSIHAKSFKEILLVFKTNRFMTLNSIYYEDQNRSNQDDLIEDFRFEPYVLHLRNKNISFPPVMASTNEPAVGRLMSLPPYSIDDLLTPNSSLTNITALQNGDTARSLLASHDGLSVNPPAAASSSSTAPIDPLHEFLLGNRTAFDDINGQQRQQPPSHGAHTSPLQTQIVAAATSPSNRLKPIGTTDIDSSSLIINGIPQIPYDLTDKEVADSMSCATNYPLVFEPVPSGDSVDVDTVFIPIKTHNDNEPINGAQEPLSLPSNYGEDQLWTKQNTIKGLKASGGDDDDDYSDPTETSDKDDDSTADEEDLLHTRIKRRSGRSPNSSQLGLNVDSLHEIRQLTHLLTELRSHRNDLSTDPMGLATTQFYNEEKLEQCCQRLEQLSAKVDRMMSFDSAGQGSTSRPSRPSPNAAPVEVLTTNEPQTTLSDTHYDRLEAILIEKIQTYIQGAMTSVFEPYREMKDNLHKDLAAKLLATDNVIKQTITQIFRSKTMMDSLGHSVSQAIQSGMVASYRDTFNQIVIPSFEKAVTNMFQQTNDVFKRGTKEYLQEMIEYGRQQQRSLIQQREQMMTEIRKETTQLNKEFEKKNQDLANSLKTEITQHLTVGLTPIIRETARSILRDEVTSTFRDVLTAQKNELNTIFRQVATPKTPVSRTTTPAPTTITAAAASPTVAHATALPSSDTKQQQAIKLVRLGQYNQAFEYVLSASDLTLVIYLCESIRPSDLFGIQPCPLQTPVLLSLIQQLAVDLNTHQQLKYSYLHEALASLDLSHPSVRGYAQNVLTDLSKKLYTYIQTNPTSPMAAHFQILLRGSQGLLQKIVQQRATPITHASPSTTTTTTK